MAITMTTAQMGSPWTWVRTGLLTAAIALLVAFTPQLTGAEKLDPTQAAEGQLKGCALAGGDGEVDVERTVEGVSLTTVTCKGGLLDGVTCFNDPQSTVCSHHSIANARPVGLPGHLCWTTPSRIRRGFRA